MSSGNAKDTRKQLRNVVQDLLPSLLQTEVFQGLYEKLHKSVQKEVTAHLEAVARDVQEALKRIDHRSQDVQSFLINQVQANTIKNNIDTPVASTEANTLAPQENGQ